MFSSPAASRVNVLQATAMATVVALVLVAGSPAFERRQSARAGHTLGSPPGDCWQAGTPLLCRTTWNSSSRIVNLGLYNQFSQVRPEWVPNMESACNQWHNFVPSTPTNDIYCHYASGGNAAVYLKTGTNGQKGLASGVYASTWNCNSSGVCSNSNIAQNIWYSEVYFNLSSGSMDTLTSAQRTKTFAHEIGHTLGLFHHQAAAFVMRQGAYNYTVSAGDYGQLPSCAGATTTWGVRCIYHFNQ
jgi:hypothetical protein